jgi:hypothetical protein
MPSVAFVMRWTHRATVKAGLLAISPGLVEDVVLDQRDERVRNHPRWRLEGRGLGLAVVYHDPDHGDRGTARIVALWRQG